MTKFNTIQNNFANGMLSPKLKGRTEIPEYKNGLDLCQNFLGYKQGGLYRRPGSRFVFNMTADNFNGPLIPVGKNVFLIGQTSTKNPHLMTYDETINTVTYKEGNVDFLVGKEYNGNTIKFDDIASFITVGGFTFITRTLDKNGAQQVPLLYYDEKLQLSTLPIVSGAGIIDPTTTYRKEEALYHAYADVNTEAGATINPSATSGTINLVSSVNLGIGSGMRGRLVKITHGSTTGVARITNTGTGSGPWTYAARVIINFASATASDNWQVSETGRLYHLAYYQQRVVYGYGNGADNSSNKIIGTRTGSPQHLMVNKLTQDLSSDSSGLNFFGELATTDPFKFEIASRLPSDITWVDGGEVLEIGTESGEFVAFGTNGALSSLDVNINQQTAFGSKSTQPIRSNKSLLAISPNGSAIREFSRSGNTTTYQTRDLNILSEDIVFSADFEKLVLQNESNVIWAVANGQLISCTYHPDVNIISWGVNDISGVVKDILVFENLLYITVERDNGTPYEALEVINLESKASKLFPVKDELNIPAFLDSWIIKDFVGATTAVSGLDHLNGIECKVLIDGVTIETHTPVAGAISTTQSGTEFLIGINYVSKIRSLPLESGGGFGTGIGSIQRINEIYALFYRTIGGRAGTDRKTFPLNILDSAAPEAPVTDRVTKKIDHGPSKENQIVIEQSEPLPMNILGLVYKGATYD